MIRRVAVIIIIEVVGVFRYVVVGISYWRRWLFELTCLIVFTVFGP